MKKLIVVAAVVPLMALGCDMGKKKPKETATSTELQQPAPTPYIPPTAGGVSNNGMADAGMSSPGTVITPITPTDLTPAPAVTEKPAKVPARSTVQRPTASKSTGSSSSSMRIGSTYTVKTGDSLSEIAAAKYGKGNIQKGVAAIKKANNLKSDVIRVGQKLKVPASL